MIQDFQNHKGDWCWIRPSLFCQEGKCPECQVYQDEKLCPTCEANLDNWVELFGQKHLCGVSKGG